MQPEHLKKFTAISALLLLCAIPATLFATPADDLAAIAARYECEEQAAIFTRNMGKPGDPTLYQQHLKDCLLIAESKRTKLTVAAPKDTTCKADEYKFTFKNNSAETIWIGVWDPGNANGGPVKPPTNWPNWQLDAGKDNYWCAPLHFNGRFMVRARCNTATGICQEGNCCSDSSKCGSMTCNTGVEPTSLVEFNFDRNFDKDKTVDGKLIKAQHPLGVTWYDVSYVDGYNFPMAINTSDETSCQPLGQGALPDCPWPTINRVCLAPYKQYAIDRPWSNFEQDFYILAAKCAYQGADNICGCGDQCPEDTINKTPKLPRCENRYFTSSHPLLQRQIELKSSGCSPFNKYELIDANGNKPGSPNWTPTYDELARTQVICNPLKARKDGDKCSFEWPNTPRDYKQYALQINKVVPKAYTWQYHDDDSLTQCPSKAGNSFTITIGPRPGNTTNGDALAPAIAPADGLSGYITVNNGTQQQFLGPNRFRRVLKKGDKVSVTSYCDQEKKTLLSCSATYDPTRGMIPDTDADCAGSLSGINWNDSASNNADLFSFARPTASVCKDLADLDATNFNIFASPDFSATARINDKEPKAFKGDYLLRLHDKDSVKMTVDCNDGYTLTCSATYNKNTGLLNLDKDQPKCEAAKDTLTWGKYVNSLRPGKPAADQCQ